MQGGWEVDFRGLRQRIANSSGLDVARARCCDDIKAVTFGRRCRAVSALVRKLFRPRMLARHTKPGHFRFADLHEDWRLSFCFGRAPTARRRFLRLAMRFRRSVGERAGRARCN